MTTTDSDSLARHLLNHTGAYDLTISAHSLENTFLALTDEHSYPPPFTSRQPQTKDSNHV